MILKTGKPKKSSSTGVKNTRKTAERARGRLWPSKEARFEKFLTLEEEIRGKRKVLEEHIAVVERALDAEKGHWLEKEQMV